ncbi:DUF7535 family protein [Halopiger djelfimassiliensis]|uniref:DUF7535 family protein n=1 Tax=Halopiger djelfimassiliensis TaxID=1293047 RepID=UPI000677A64D|nr:hypothetical protein [Halopiger djelfimassiliensis]
MSTKVSESTGYVPNVQMSLFGYVMAAILVIIMLPVLPIIVVAWVFWRAFVAEEPPEARYETWRNEMKRSRPMTTDEPDAVDESESDAEPAAEESPSPN